ncbi:DUF3592 domain-containing protein [Prauserella cavernicola]|uniref:DUF3592 domain-containing protein n=1 Tax=Prauserella cavernicola TaxID=2800127 RepID=A0A934QQ65_9PSEU|nr:DUF3592 domain-containing protein [Prauserella cavernicola]MBK1784111.1 DUF3592 domain-containing protein [Prauserella cavernicola]
MDELSLIGIAGLCLLVAGIGLLARARLFRARAARASGRIVKVDVTAVENGSNVRTATVEFVTEDGREITTKGGDIGSRRLREGSRVTVLYSRGNPDVAYIEGTSMRGGWIGWLLISFGLCAVLVFVLGLLVGPEAG